ncbi:FtsX-like permease family protein [Ilyomonas limi]|uniref:FtsX-like permease family protein n=1 Tax=Ilyomonas limi TaxID=2575867 RepID=A0A4U3L3W3_9BACT|nr:ABC transporter permease [Ilyomonas limi]TKK68276.1 FtsX-like permease family protein [Ilyomonas limi]
MFNNYFKTAWRNLLRNKAFSLINILGLALGLACSLLIFLWVQDERSVDAFHKNGRDLYQVYERSHYDGKIDASYTTQGLLAEELKNNIPQIQYASGLEYASAPGAQNTFEAGDKINKMSGMFAGEDFFKMFSFHLLQGNAATAISDPASIAISKKMAELFFGNPSNAIGKTITFDNKENLLVTAVFEDVPHNSSLQFDFLRSWTDFVAQNNWVHNWSNTSPQTFVQLRKDADAAKVQAQIKDFIYRYQSKTKGLKTELALQPFTQRYLYSNFKDGYIDGGRIEYVRLFSIVAIFILLIACINFMNLTTARSARRAKEVGIRKVIGALRISLIKQFIGEALLVTLLAIVIALVLVSLLLPSFNQLTGKQLILPLHQFDFWIMITALLLLTGLIAGSYPAFFMASFKPVRVLKGSLKLSWTNIFFRKGLVVFQFALSVMFIIATIVIYQQMQYVQTKNMGYNRDNLLYIPIEGDLVGKYEVFKQQALNNTTILNVSKMRNSPTVIEHHTNSIDWPAKDPNLQVSFADGVVGYDFIKTMDLQLLAGRDFSKAYNDSTSFILNETAVNKIGFKNPVGQTVSWGNRKGMVVGVVKDFHFSSLHQQIEPLIIRLDENWSWGTILVRVKGGQTKQAIASLQRICKQLNPKFPFTYQFSDAEYAKLYNSEQVVSKLSSLFAFLAIFISCLGLFGLAMFTAEQRSKEIGIRKVLGASAKNIVALLSVNFLKPVAIAFLIAFPVAWFAMNNWLQGFAYRIHISWLAFVIAGVAAILIALITISFQSIKAAIANPVKSLRTE